MQKNVLLYSVVCSVLYFVLLWDPTPGKLEAHFLTFLISFKYLLKILHLIIEPSQA
jgi:hypothetical protein